MCQIAGEKTFQRWEETKEQGQDLVLQGRATDSIWVLGDGQEPYKLGLRLDFGDCGTVFLTREQARQVATTLSRAITIETAERQ